MQGYVLRREPGGRGVHLWRMDTDSMSSVSPTWSQKVYNHSPDGFELGYGGSGPAQSALAILLDYLSRRVERLKTGQTRQQVESQAVALHQDFKSAFVAREKDLLELTDEQIETWILEQEASSRAG